MLPERIKLKNGLVLEQYTKTNARGCKVIITNKNEISKILELFLNREENIVTIDVIKFKNFTEKQIVDSINDIYNSLILSNLYVDAYSSLDAASYILSFINVYKKSFRKVILLKPNLNVLHDKIYNPLYSKLIDCNVICISNNQNVLDYCIYNNLLYLKLKESSDVIRKLLILFDAYYV